MKVLIVEDDPDIQLILKMVLTRMGKCEVAATSMGGQAFGLAKSERPDLILLDCMLPEMNGYEICKALKADDATSRIPVIFLTARSQPAELQQAMTLGAAGYLAKPFDPMTLISQINQILSPYGTIIGS